MAMEFRLQSVLKIRQQARDLLQKAVLTRRADHAKALQDRDALGKLRATIIDELRCLNENPDWDVAAVSQRQQYAEDLADALIKADLAIDFAFNELDSSLQKLVSADQAVRALELLKEKQIAESRTFQSKRNDRDIEDAFQAYRRSP